MPTATYIALANYTVPAGGVSSVTFSSIPATYRDLVVVCVPIAPASGQNYFSIRFNSDTGGNYSQVYMWGRQQDIGSTTNSFAGRIGARALTTPSNYPPYIINIMDYSATDKHKTLLMRESTSDQDVVAHAGRYASTSAISTVMLFLESNANFSQGSSFALYGIVS